MKNQAAITIGGVEIKAGEKRSIDLPLPMLYTHSQLPMPVYVHHSKRPGPCLFVSAAIHGDEINGVEIIRRLLRSKSLRYLRGTLIAIPVVNVFGFINKTRYLPDRRDLNRFFPGNEEGSLASQIATVFLQNVVRHCDYGIDLHTAAVGRSNLPQIRAKLDSHPALRTLAKAFRAPITLNTNVQEGTLRQATDELGIPTLLYEAGEALRFDEIPIRAGLNGVLSVMRHLEMLPQKKISKEQFNSLMSNSSKWVRAPQSGILHTVQNMGNHVQEGEILGYVADPFGDASVEIPATQSGIIIGRSTLPLVHKGEALFHIARITDEEDAINTMESFQHELDPDTERPFY